VTSRDLPWNKAPLDRWAIVGMNHHLMAGIKILFVAMADGKGHCIKSEGTDDMEVFRELYKKAVRYERK
jgi:hypothetical protein